MTLRSIFSTTASALALAFVVYACKGHLSEAEKLDLAQTPLQTVDSMFFVQSENGVLKMRVEAPRMESYEHDTLSYDLFPKGIHVYAYAEDGSLETTIVARQARHDKYPRRIKDERWSAYGDVLVTNILKRETMETDTLYWDSDKREIWTDCYIKLSAPSGYMQGVGMRSDEMARNAILLNPFDNEFLLESDSTRVVIDTVNFIGPLPKK